MGLKLFGTWYSGYSKRVEIALKLKGVEYEYVEEDLLNKSEELLKHNPIHKKVPVLIDGGKTLCESLVILEYVDEIWKDNPLLPSDPYERAQARFWAQFFDEKVLPSFGKAVMQLGPVEEAEEALSILENAIKDMKVLGGKGMGLLGYMEIVAVTIFHWLPPLQEAVGMELLKREKHPAILAWADELSTCSVVQEILPEKARLLEHYTVRIPALRAELLASK